MKAKKRLYFAAPERVTTVAELASLEVGSVIRQAPEDSFRVESADGSWEQGGVAELRLDSAGQPAWFLVGQELGWRSHQLGMLPATVLFRPTTPISRVAPGGVEQP